MASSAIAFPECCRYCPHRAEVSSACDHGARQSLIRDFSARADRDRSCPVFDDFRAEEMSKLSNQLDDVLGSRT